MEKLDIKEYEKRHNSKFSDRKISVIYRIDRWIYFETKYGLCRKKESDIGKSCYGISSAIDKTEFLKNRLLDLYNNVFDYSLVKYENAKSKITLICKKHGEFEANTGSAMFGSAWCRKCADENSGEKRKFTLIQFVEKANLKHNYKYDYSKSKYVRDKSKDEIIIICPIHGEFKQRSGSHLQGRGCYKCGRDKIQKTNSTNSPGWRLSSWIESSQKSKNFDSFKLYVLKCWNDTEEFYKIGRTFVSIKKRFKSKSEMPYNYKIIEVYENTAENIFKLESKFKKINKNYKYIPRLKFNGIQECFTKVKI